MGDHCSQQTSLSPARIVRPFGRKSMIVSEAVLLGQLPQVLEQALRVD